MNRRTFLKFGLATAASVIPAGTIFAVQSTELEISHQRVVLPGLGRRLRIVAISDLHGRSHYLDMNEMISIVNGYQPDIFILAGDIIDRRKDLGLVNEFAAIKAKLLKAAVMGNREYHNYPSRQRPLRPRMVSPGERLDVCYARHRHLGAPHPHRRPAGDVGGGFGRRIGEGVGRKAGKKV